MSNNNELNDLSQQGEINPTTPVTYVAARDTNSILNTRGVNPDLRPFASSTSTAYRSVTGTRAREDILSLYDGTAVVTSTLSVAKAGDMIPNKDKKKRRTTLHISDTRRKLYGVISKITTRMVENNYNRYDVSEEIKKDHFEKMTDLQLAEFQTECEKLTAAKDSSVDERTLQLRNSVDLQAYIKRLSNLKAFELQDNKKMLLDKFHQVATQLVSIQDNLLLVEHTLESKVGDDIQVQQLLRWITKYKFMKMDENDDLDTI